MPLVCSLGAVRRSPRWPHREITSLAPDRTFRILANYVIDVGQLKTIVLLHAAANLHSILERRITSLNSMEVRRSFGQIGKSRRAAPNPACRWARSAAGRVLAARDADWSSGAAADVPDGGLQQAGRVLQPQDNRGGRQRRGGPLPSRAWTSMSAIAERRREGSSPACLRVAC